jgi:hypothetical protein
MVFLRRKIEDVHLQVKDRKVLIVEGLENLEEVVYLINIEKKMEESGVAIVTKGEGVKDSSKFFNQKSMLELLKSDSRCKQKTSKSIGKKLSFFYWTRYI